jgi:uncharacterized membrane protein
VVAAPACGYLQFVAYDTLVGIAAEADAVVRLLYQPGHFVVQGLPLANVWPPDAAGPITRRLEQAHFTGPHRTLAQDLAFAIHQLVEIAIRALSPAVNDTFTALTCIDWLTDGLCKISAAWDPRIVQRDTRRQCACHRGRSTLRTVGRASFRQDSTELEALSAVVIRQLEALARIMAQTSSEAQRLALASQANMILRSSEDSVPEESDRASVRRHHDAVVSVRATRSAIVP